HLDVVLFQPGKLGLRHDLVLLFVDVDRRRRCARKPAAEGAGEPPAEKVLQRALEVALPRGQPLKLAPRRDLFSALLLGHGTSPFFSGNFKQWERGRAAARAPVLLLNIYEVPTFYLSPPPSGLNREKPRNRRENFPEECKRGPTGRREMEFIFYRPANR